jgi:hypothetical protein
MFSQKAAGRRFSRIFVPKNLPDAILIFGRHFGFFSNLLFFPKNMSIFFIKIILQNEKIFIQSKIRHFGLCLHFERFSETLFHKMLVLSTTKQGRDL